MKVNIVLPESFGQNWIMHKIVQTLTSELRDHKDLQISISEEPQPNVDINHYGHYQCYNKKNFQKGTKNTTYITHVDALWKFSALLTEMRDCDAGICMSLDHMNQLIQLGCPKDKLCCVRIGIDHVVQKRKITIAFPFRNYPDGRKRISTLLNILPVLSPDIFQFKIIGGGWDSEINTMRSLKFSVSYQPDFSIEAYKSFFADADYAMFFGWDEGSIGMVDAVDAGVPVIVTRQGYHLDLGDGIYKLYDTEKELKSILLEIQKKKMAVIQSVETWTWKNFADFHYTVWKKIMAGESVADLKTDQKAVARTKSSFFFTLLKNSLYRKWLNYGSPAKIMKAVADMRAKGQK